MILAAVVSALGSAALAQQSPALPQTVSRSELNAKLDSGFKELDTNHDGFLSRSEVQAAQGRDLQRLQTIARAKMQEQFRQLDTNKDGQLSFQEFAALATVKLNETPDQVMQKLDTNHDGRISAAEYKAPRIGAFDKLDLNHDGIVTQDEARRAASQK